MSLLTWTARRTKSGAALRETRRMDDKARDQIRRQFAEATALLEDAHEVAVEAQSPKVTARNAAQKSKELAKAARKLERLARGGLRGWLLGKVGLEFLLGRFSPVAVKLTNGSFSI